MPTYEYRCTECDHDFEVFQKFSDAPLTTCPVCQGVLRKVFSPVGIVFKGSGFYSTDSHHSGAIPPGDKHETKDASTAAHETPGHETSSAASGTADAPASSTPTSSSAASSSTTATPTPA